MMIKRNKMMNTRLNLDKRPYYLTYSVHYVPVTDDKIYDLLSIVIDRLEEAFEEYSLIDESVVYVQLTFRRLDTKLLSVFSLDKSNHISNTDIISTKRKLNLPVSVSEDSLGKPLNIVVENNKILDIILIFNNKRINFLDVIRDKHSDNITDFDPSFKFYLLKDVNYYILAVKYIEKSSLEKIRYSLDGVVINRVIDRKDNNNLVVRKSGEKEIILANKKVLMTKQNIKLKCIEKPNSNVLFIGNPNIGVIDTETFLAKDNIYNI